MNTSSNRNKCKRNEEVEKGNLREWLSSDLIPEASFHILLCFFLMLLTCHFVGKFTIIARQMSSMQHPPTLLLPSLPSTLFLPLHLAFLLCFTRCLCHVSAFEFLLQYCRMIDRLYARIKKSKNKKRPRPQTPSICRSWHYTLAHN